MKYYLLTFNEDWANEHNVPALACFSEEEYQKWLDAPKGKQNKKYLEQKVAYDNQKKAYDDWQSEFYKTTSVDQKEWLKENPRPSYVSYSDEPRKGTSFISAYLGNSGDSFDENFTDYLTGHDFVADNTVRVYDVNEEFKKVFDTARLADLSLCNVFDMGLDDWESEEEEEVDEL